MDVELSFEERPGYLHVAVRGQMDRTTVRNHLAEVRARADRAGVTRILLDAFEVAAPRSELDRHMLGLSIAELFVPGYRVAALYRVEWINKFAENTAVNRGANFLVESNAEEALRWLLRD